MTKILLVFLLVLSLAVPVNALEITAPDVPFAASGRMPQSTDSFGKSLLELIRNSIPLIPQEIQESLQVSSEIIFAAFLVSLLSILTEKASSAVSVAGVAMISAVMFQHTGTMIGYASSSALDICAYGKLLCPVMTTALAAQGGITASAALYTGTTAFITFLSVLISEFFIPMVNVFLVFSVSHCALGEEVLKKLADLVKNLLSWLLKTMLIGFATYMSVTGVVGGTTDTVALKATKVTISSVVPVVGGILSDVSESVLVSMGILKNAAGVYGILAVLAVFAEPFVKVGVQYLMLKASAALCGIFGNKKICVLVESFSAAMGLLLAMVAAGCLLVLISTVCYLKGCG